MNFQYQTCDFSIHVPVNLSTYLQSPLPIEMSTSSCSFQTKCGYNQTRQSYLELSTLTTTMLRLETSFCRTSYSPVDPTTSEAEGKVNSCLHGLLVIPYRLAILESWKATGCNSLSCVQNGLSKIWGSDHKCFRRACVPHKIYYKMYRNNKTQIR